MARQCHCLATYCVSDVSHKSLAPIVDLYEPTRVASTCVKHVKLCEPEGSCTVRSMSAPLSKFPRCSKASLRYLGDKKAF